ncbi:MAG TPA: hypothetical protein VNQ99_08725 [Xanthobacteraceae bacterium]|nr:hypothetical protein [Xanthobacteraceae bacterium]
MADITITAANVQAGVGAQLETGRAGAAITAGQWVYRDTDDKYKLADNNAVAAIVRVPVGVALHAAAVNQPLTIQKAGTLAIGGTLVAGVVYYLSDTPGGMCPVADLTTGEYPCIVGIAKSTSVLDMVIKSAGVAL